MASTGALPAPTAPGWLALAAAVVAVLWVADLFYVWRGVRKLTSLDGLPPADESECPPVTVCVAARDEADDVEEALGSVLALDYPELEVVAVDDRSTDGTGGILDRLAAEDARLTALHVDELPGGWLGKNHALHAAAREADGELLLFTDADVVMEPTALRRVVGRMERDGLDHLAAAPRQDWPNSLLRGVGALLQLSLLHRLRPWRVGEEGSDAFVGVGAFNLVRSEAYRRAGGHAAIARRPVDDMALAERLRDAGGRAGFVSGGDLLRVRWYGSVGELSRGVGRSLIADLGYSSAAAVLAAAALLLFHVFPWVGVIALGGAARWLCGAAVLATVAVHRVLPGTEGGRARDVLWWPVAGLVLAWTSVRAAVLLRRRGGIVWRETFYPLEELRGGDGEEPSGRYR